MRRFILFLALIALAAPAWAVDTTKYPSTIVDSTCTDSFDVPARVTPPTVALPGSGGNITFAQAEVQISGSADGWCDHDSYIKQDPITSDGQEFGPFKRGNFTGVVIAADITVTATAPAQLRFWVATKRPYDDFVDAYAQSAPYGVTESMIAFSGHTVDAANISTFELEEWVDTILPPVFWVIADLETTTTSATAQVSLIGF